MIFIFSVAAHRSFRKLPLLVRRAVQRALERLAAHGDVSHAITKLAPPFMNRFRLRVGEYRVLLARERGETWIILDVGHRRDVYRA